MPKALIVPCKHLEPLYLDSTQMSRILNLSLSRDKNERWKMYKEILSGDIFTLSKRRKDEMTYAPKTKMRTTIREVLLPARQRLTLIFFVIFRENCPSNFSHSSGIIMRNDHTAKEHERNQFCPSNIFTN